MTLTELKKIGKGLGFTIQKDYDIRVNIIGDPEKYAYYANDISDAYDTMLEMFGEVMQFDFELNPILCYTGF